MTIRITAPQNTSSGRIRNLTRKYLQEPWYSRNTIFCISDNIINIDSNGLTLILYIISNETIEFFRDYISYIFKDKYIGVEFSNPITTNLQNVREYILL